MKSKILFAVVMIFAFTAMAQQITRHTLLSTGNAQTTQTKGKYVLQQTNVRSIGGRFDKTIPPASRENIFSVENIFPNPANDKIVLNTKSSADGKVQFKLLTVYGAVALETLWKQTEKGNNTTSLDISNLTAGVYFVRVSFITTDSNSTTSSTSKLIKLY